MLLISRTRSHLFLALAALLTGVACFLPWRGNDIANLSGFNGALGNPGTWVLLLLALRVLAHFIPFKWGRQGAVLISLVLVGIGLNHLKIGLRLEMAGPQIGIFLLLVGSIGLFILSLYRKL